MRTSRQEPSALLTLATKEPSARGFAGTLNRAPSVRDIVVDIGKLAPFRSWPGVLPAQPGLSFTLSRCVLAGKGSEASAAAESATSRRGAAAPTRRKPCIRFADVDPPEPTLAHKRQPLPNELLDRPLGIAAPPCIDGDLVKE